MREVTVRDYPHSEGKVVRVEVSYHKSGLMKRGYWMHIQPMGVETRDGFTVQSYFPTDGYRMLLLEAQRFSQKGLSQAAEKAVALLDSDDAVRVRIERAAASLNERVEV